MLAARHRFGSGAPGTVALPAAHTANAFGTSSLTIDSDGKLYDAAFSAGTPWLTPQTGMDQFQVKGRNVSSTGTITGTFDSWMPCTADRIWSVSTSTAVGRTMQLEIQIRRASDGVILDTKTYTLTAEGLG